MVVSCACEMGSHHFREVVAEVPSPPICGFCWRFRRLLFAGFVGGSVASYRRRRNDDVR